MGNVRRPAMHMAVMASLMAKLVKMVARLVMAQMTVMAVAVLTLLMNENMCRLAMQMAVIAMLGNVHHQAIVISNGNGDGTLKRFYLYLCICICVFVLVYL